VKFSNPRVEAVENGVCAACGLWRFFQTSKAFVVNATQLYMSLTTYLLQVVTALYFCIEPQVPLNWIALTGILCEFGRKYKLQFLLPKQHYRSFVYCGIKFRLHKTTEVIPKEKP